VKFLIDAQLPLRLGMVLTQRGHEVVHTRWLPLQNKTSDTTLRILADTEDRILVSKDADFVASHLILGSPTRLLHIATGNISNEMLNALVTKHLDMIESAFDTSRYVELSSSHLIVHAETHD
jgi:predicted nuclease of predicted toxin-antitoxin system